MDKNYKLRMAVLADVNEILDIYRPYVENTAITFEYEVPSADEFGRRMDCIMKYFPFIVCEYCGELVGYAYASRQKTRAAYQWNAELSVYIKRSFQRKHIGTLLYKAIIEILKAQGFVNAYAVITHPNEKSELFHNKFGFTSAGISPKTGWKFGQWYDTSEMVLRISDLSIAPRETLSCRALDRDLIQEKLDAVF
ncbi:MAG: N-acetyltransferase family protein [Oscillospiraceae bacterium]